MHYILVVDDLGEGGAERAAHNLSNYLISEKHQVTFIFLKNYIIYPIHKDINVIYLKEDFTKIDRRLVTPFFYSPLKKILSGYDASSTRIVSFNNVSSFLVGIFKKYHPQYTCLLSIQSSFIHFSTSWLKRSIILPLMLHTYNYYNHIIVVSSKIKKETEKFKFKDKVSVIVNPVDIKMVEQKCLEPLKLEDNSKFRFINVGRFHPQKNHVLLVEALALLKRSDVCLYFVGQGQLESSLRTLCNELKIEKQVHFVGLQLNPFKFLKQCDCFVLSSDYEGFPNVLIEAMACGLPIVSTDCPTGPREVLAPNSLKQSSFIQQGNIEYAENGLLVPLQDSHALSKAMALMIENQSLRSQYAQKARERAQDFDIHKIFSHFENIVT
jgi:N-acetylgalactosamine-N,N'-diacetylbacillosaminyl-diphospho-undecaprenol 4-alpha-N-acetylgalactosaminyltransferase